MVGPWWVRGGSAVGPWWVHGWTMVGSWWTRGGSMVLTWWVHIGPMVFPWWVDGAVITGPWLAHPWSMVGSWWVLGGSMVFTWWVHIGPMVFPWWVDDTVIFIQLILCVCFSLIFFTTHHAKSILLALERHFFHLTSGAEPHGISRLTPTDSQCMLPYELTGVTWQPRLIHTCGHLAT